jgi:large subunit ribosomal protein L4
MSLNLDVISTSGKKAGKVGLPEALFGADVNIALIHQVVVAQLAAARQGTASTKTRGEVSGGGIKPWRQKGTGRARQGSRRAPQWAGGGTVFGPQPRSYAQRTNKKMIAAALRSALSDRFADGKVFVLDSLVDSEVPSTKKALEALSTVGDYRTALVVLHRDDDVAWLSLRNVVNVHALAVDQLNVYDVVNNEVVVFTKPALEEYIARSAAKVEGIVLEYEAPEADDAPAEVTEVEEAPAEKPAKAKKAAKADKAEVEDESAAEVAEVDEAPAEKPAKAKKAAKAEVVEEPAAEESVPETAVADEADAEEAPAKPAKAPRAAKAAKKEGEK